MRMTGSASGSKRLPYRLLAGYGIGQAGAQVFRDTPAALLPLFLTTMLGVPPWIAGLTVIIPKLWVIICDPLIGGISDRLNDRYGRRPFLIVGAILTNVGFIALFSVASFPNPLITAGLVSLLFLLGSTAFSAFSVPYLALASELSDDANERSRLISGRMVGAILGVIAGVGLGQPLMALFGGGARGWQMMAVVLAVACMVAMLVTAFSLGRPRVAERHTGRSLFGGIRDAFGEAEFRWLTLTYLVQCIGQACGYTVINFVFLYNVGNVNLILPFVLLMSIGSVASQPVWLAVGRRIGSEAAFLIATIGWVLITITAFTIRPGTDVLLTLPVVGPISTPQAIVLARAIPIAFFNCGFLLFIFSMLTDTITRIRARNGTVNEGVYSGIFSATEKVSFAIAPVIAGIIMSLSHFTASTGGAQAQGASALNGVLLLYSLIPAAFVGVSVLVFLGYRNAVRRTNSGAPVLAAHHATV
jgi:GPH family glycoside/pentoside/hexuronide:cation symporter